MSENSLVCIRGVRGYEQDGVAHLHIEDVARGLGFTRTAESGNEVVRWERVDGYLSDLKFVPTRGHDGNPHDYYIPENTFYRLCMKAKNEVAEKFQAKVADEIIPSIRKAGGYGILTVDDMINDPDTAIRLLTQLKILRLQNDQLAMERDEAIRKRAMIGSSREATAMATASAKSRECKRLTAENAELKDAVGRGTNWRTVAMMTAEWKRDFGHAPSWQKLKLFSADLPTDMQPIKDVEVKVILHNGSVKTNTVFRYHREAWAKYREYEENLHVPDKNARDAKILDLRAADIEIEYF